ncbi:class I SAM-dependent methyltransferase [Xanthomonas perforans]|nr:MULTISPECIES: class I SAM-dependent methyltransferase [Xanthomonas]MBV6687775.1 class I SAM-dependent methyltransferase [Xanthomonas euvesicatoria pv. physalidis]MBV6777489.1 class I SAM-dependent methyltransferase [Xanthomonas campestris pv. carissae]MBV6786814.1 class I SAM-dependent methyltransferase [Xanthomonas campestris pv. uppalii]MBV6792842.1 class I SAM-dependent methyltransferase [Xanthomonas campestris pv. daturae]MBZ2412440.1 class I SAM-dependent methyltransferase [Xanthomonas
MAYSLGVAEGSAILCIVPATGARMHADLPTPDPDALAHSDRLAAHVRAEIQAAGGAIPFSRFMELALYAPGLGYYSAGASKFGEAGDFVTAPELGPLFAATVSGALAPVLQQLGPQARVLEVGGGSGAFAEVTLKRLLELDALPERYAILEPSADLRERQRERLGRSLIPPVFDLVEWLDAPFQDDWDGVLFANEVIDALPTPRFALRDGQVYEETVVLDAQQHFARGEQPADALLSAAVRHLERYLEQPFADGYRSELLPQLPYWIQAVAGGLKRGAMLFVDYGYPRGEFYRAQREDGTLRAFYRHRMHEDLYRWPGLQDLTASVDFTALAEAGTGAGFELAGYCTQASFLLGNGLDALLAQADTRTDEVGRMRLREQIKRLTLPSEMGERFQVMGFSRDVDFAPAFLSGDLTWRL